MATATKTTGKGKATKATKATKEAPKYVGFERDHDLPWCPKKVAIFQALKALKATSESNGVGAKEIAEKANVTERDVRHYVYHAMAANLTAVAKREEDEGGRGYKYYLTATGRALDAAKELAKQEKAKANGKE